MSETENSKFFDVEEDGASKKSIFPFTCITKSNGIYSFPFLISHVANHSLASGLNARSSQDPLSMFTSMINHVSFTVGS